MALLGVQQLATGMTLFTFAYLQKWAEMTTILAILGFFVAERDGIFVLGMLWRLKQTRVSSKVARHARCNSSRLYCSEISIADQPSSNSGKHPGIPNIFEVSILNRAASTNPVCNNSKGVVILESSSLYKNCIHCHLVGLKCSLGLHQDNSRIVRACWADKFT